MYRIAQAKRPLPILQERDLRQERMNFRKRSLPALLGEGGFASGKTGRGHHGNPHALRPSKGRSIGTVLCQPYASTGSARRLFLKKNRICVTLSLSKGMAGLKVPVSLFQNTPPTVPPTPPHHHESKPLSSHVASP